MFKNTYQCGLLTVFFSCGSSPLSIWEMKCQNGHIKRITDAEVNSVVLEIVSTNVATTYITCPRNNGSLGIKLPFLVMIVKNMKRYFSFEITILDDKNMRRRFRISNFQSTTKIKPFCTTMPIGLAGGWNQIQFNLSDFTRRAYGTQYMETLRVQVHANVRLRRIYFADRLFTEDELPQDYKLYLPMMKKTKKVMDKKGEAAVPVPPPAVAEEVIPTTEAPPTPVEEAPPLMDKKSEAVMFEPKEEEVGLEAAPATEVEEPSEAPAEAPTPTEEGKEPPEGHIEVKEEAEEGAEDAPAPAEGEEPPPPTEAEETPAPAEGEEPPAE